MVDLIYAPPFKCVHIFLPCIVLEWVAVCNKPYVDAAWHLGKQAHIEACVYKMPILFYFPMPSNSTPKNCIPEAAIACVSAVDCFTHWLNVCAFPERYTQNALKGAEAPPLLCTSCLWVSTFYSAAGVILFYLVLNLIWLTGLKGTKQQNP